MLHVSAPHSHHQASTEEQIHIIFLFLMDLFFGRSLTMALWS